MIGKLQSLSAEEEYDLKNFPHHHRQIKESKKILITDGFFLSKFPIFTFSRRLIFCQPQFHLHAYCVIRCRQKQGVDGPYKRKRKSLFGVITGVVGLTYFNIDLGGLSNCTLTIYRECHKITSTARGKNLCITERSRLSLGNSSPRWWKDSSADWIDIDTQQTKRNPHTLNFPQHFHLYVHCKALREVNSISSYFFLNTILSKTSSALQRDDLDVCVDNVFTKSTAVLIRKVFVTHQNLKAKRNVHLHLTVLARQS